MSYEFTEQALINAKSMLASQEANTALRLYLEGKNCDGFNYGICFSSKIDHDLVFDIEGVQLLVDKDTHLYTKGTKVDWHTVDGQDGFLVTNPNQQKFRGKFFKRQAWQDFLSKDK